MSEQKGALRVALGVATGAGGVLAQENPEGADLIITRFVLDVTTPATGAATADAGVAANGSTSSDNLLDGQDIGTAAAIFDNVDDQGTNGQSVAKWAAGEYVTVSASADPAGLEGFAYIEYIRE